MKFKKQSGSVQQPQKFNVENNLVVVKYGGQLPPRCVKCNKTARIGIKQRLQWMPFWVRPMSVVARHIVGKQTIVTIGLCQEHRKKSQIIENIGWLILFLGIAAGLGAIFVPMSYCQPMIIAGVITFLVGLIVGSYGTPVKAAYMDGYLVKIKGCCPEFLQSVARDVMEEREAN